MKIKQPTTIILFTVVLVVVALALFYLLYRQEGGGREVSSPPLPDYVKGVPEQLKVHTPAFGVGERIPREYTCEGADVSPEVRIEGVPQQAKSLVLIVYDPDAPVRWFIHWILYDVPVSVTVIPRGVEKYKASIPGLGLQGTNYFGYVGYGGPCPPRGHGAHRYVFLVLAVDTETLGLGPGASYEEVVRAIRGHIVAYGYTYGVYSR
jgi:hypothetical protein